MTTRTLIARVLLGSALYLSAMAGCGADVPEPRTEDVPAGPSLRSSRVTSCGVQFGDDVSSVVRDRVVALLKSTGGLDVEVLDASADAVRTGKHVVIGFGDTTVSRLLIRRSQVTALGPEGFVIAGDEAGGTRFYAAWGNARRGATDAVIGNGFAAFALLEKLGFAFLQPLAPTVPRELAQPSAFTVSERPALEMRGIHLHTMHPIELTHVLNGWGPGGPDDEAGFESLCGEWSLYLDWLMANRQNTVEWVLLEDDAWATFSRSSVRQERLALLNAMADDYGVTTVASAALRLKQQHAFRLIREDGDLASQSAQLRATVDWLAAAGFDSISTESGTSEFTHEAADLMLGTMNELARYTDERYGMPTSIKVHASTGQTVSGFADPVSGGDLNINFLPYYADARLAVMPHTVQHYGLDDPAPTYGNTSFANIQQFAALAATQRDVIWYPESAYWVSFDIDVPLFLPLYAERRIHDLRLLHAAGVPLRGQMLFSSGWEWGYWLNDALAARASWTLQEPSSTDQEAFTAALNQVFPAQQPLVSALAAIANHERSLLILGEYGLTVPSTVVRRNGQAYLQGFEAFDDVADLAADTNLAARLRTQPDKLGLVELRNPFHAAPSTDELDGLLRAMERTFASDAATLAAALPANAPGAFVDLAEAMRMTAWRAEQVHSLYSYAAGRGSVHLANARRVLGNALELSSRHAYHADAARIAGWGPNPTAYRFGYLWTARTLYYWFRDEAKADVAPVSPCYLNILNFLEIGFGEGISGIAADIVGAVSSIPFVGSLAECLVDPSTEPALGTWR